MGPIRVVSYNVLSSSLAAPSHFDSCDPSNLDSSVRLERVLKKLEPEIKKNSIICLQEVSMMWAGKLEHFFGNRDYRFVYHLYGGKRNGYMGVGIAFSRNEFVSEQVDIQCLADTHPGWPKPILRAGIVNALSKGIDKVFAPAKPLWSVFRKVTGFKRPIEDWNNAKDRKNAVTFVRLKEKNASVNGKGEEFCIGTYHMPCAFRAPKVMAIHAALIKQYMESMSAGAPYVLAGDFNIKPVDDHGSESLYKLLTIGELAEDDPAYPTFPPRRKTNWSPVGGAPLYSAYALATGCEPDFTNYAKTKADTEPFIGTLDYIFVSARWWIVKEVSGLPTRDSVTDGPFPNANEPSDHIMIAATIELHRNDTNSISGSA
ncbi:hypothetical protein CYMTET_48292 [Cymbomonas tetramitiformis]|uniref:Endonuclease/exonuclease/phosphatase domain-containing protein n=1 Tax=Cymbomonas tetramitiformis TaxID=36881 RepID=A0AAE0BSL1_9CHLO|nr:hypothetical protein CYMTET_48292 [Cymbomonas tetramitiformis]